MQESSGLHLLMLQIELLRYEMGIDYNTDPDLVSLTPEVDVGYDRAEYRIRIERPNNFRRGDVLTYIPASETSLTGLTKQPYFYVLTGYCSMV